MSREKLLEVPPEHRGLSWAEKGSKENLELLPEVHGAPKGLERIWDEGWRDRAQGVDLG